MLRHLYTDDKQELSISRIGLILTIILSIGTILTDIILTIATHNRAIPNTVYTLEATMFMSFVSWVTGPRMAAFISPQIGAAAGAISKATRDVRLPSRTDNEKGE